MNAEAQLKRVELTNKIFEKIEEAIGQSDSDKAQNLANAYSLLNDPVKQ